MCIFVENKNRKIMNNNEQFKINSIEELEQAYEMFEKEWYDGYYLESEKKDFQESLKLRWIIKDCEGLVMLEQHLEDFTEIPSPLKQPQYPCEMLVSSDNCNWHKRTVIAKHEGNYYAVNNHVRGATGWSYVKHIPQTIELPKAQAKAIIRNAQNLDPNTEIIITD